MRRSAQIGLGAAAVALLGLSLLVRVPTDRTGVRQWTVGGGREILPPGLHVRIPLLQRVALHPTALGPITVEAPNLRVGGGELAVGCEFAGRIDARLLLDPGREAAPEPLAAGLERILAAGLAETIPFQGAAELLLHGPPAEVVALLEARLAAAGLADPAVSCGPARPAPGGKGPAGLPEVLRESGSLRTGVRVLLIGLDGADWSVVRPLLERGELPNIGRLLRHGTGGRLRSFEPLLSPLLWTTVVTGVNPDRHGILDFLVTDPATGEPVPIGSGFRRARAIWNLASEFSRSTSFVGWWATWPAETIRGTMVSDRVAYSLFPFTLAEREIEAAISPAAEYAELSRRFVAAESVPLPELRRFVDLSRADYARALEGLAGPAGSTYRDPVAHLLKVIASTRTYHGISLDLLARGQPDLFGVFYQGIDEVSHRFAHYMPPRMEMVAEADYRRFRHAVERFYVWQDELIGELLAAAAPDTMVVLLSDHGFLTGRDRPKGLAPDIEGKPDRWHRLDGLLVLSGGPVAPARGAGAGPELRGATLYDIAPTLLYVSGLPLSSEMPGLPLFDALDPEFVARTPLYQVDSFGPPATRSAENPLRSAADEEIIARLRSLGYLGGGEAPAGGSGEAGPAATFHANRAYLLLDQGDREGARSEVERALAERPDYLPALVLRTRILEEGGDPAAALAAARLTLREGIRQGDRQPGNLVQIARLFIALGDPAGGLGELTGLRSRIGDGPELRVALGELRLAAGDGPGAESDFRAAVRLDPASDQAVRRLFFLLIDRGDLVAAEEVVGQALALAPESVVHHNLLGLLRLEQNDPEGAESEFRIALRLDPGDPPTLANLGGALGRAGRLEEAVELLRQAVELEPENREAQVNLAAALGRLGQLPEVIYRLEAARAGGIESPEILNALALAYYQSGREGEAVSAFRDSLALRPDQPQVESFLRNLSAGSPGRPAGGGLR